MGDIAALNVRIRLALRHCGVSGEPRGGYYGEVMHRREFGDLLIDMVARRVSLRGEALSLTRTEFEILSTLAESPGEPVTCRHLQLSLWGGMPPTVAGPRWGGCTWAIFGASWVRTRIHRGICVRCAVPVTVSPAEWGAASAWCAAVMQLVADCGEDLAFDDANDVGRHP